MDTFISSTIQRLEKSYINGFKLGASNGNPGTFKDPVLKEKFKNQFVKLCQLEQEKKDEINLITSFQCSAVDQFDREYSQKLAELKKNCPNPLNNDRYIKFAAEIDSVVILEHDSETQGLSTTTFGDDMEVKETQNYIDPISKTQIRDPVKNIVCGHIYDRNSIHAAVSANRRTRCPYMGCSNKRHVALADLVDDCHLKALIDLLFTQKQQEEDEDYD